VNDQLKAHPRGRGRVLRSKLSDLVHQEIRAYLIVHHAISALTARASSAADLDLDSISFATALRLIRRTATETAAIPPADWTNRLPTHLVEIALLLIPPRRERTCPRAVNEPGTTATESRNPASQPAPNTMRQPRSTSADFHPKQLDHLTLRGIGPYGHGVRGGRDAATP
jgi:hypothetical protein